MIELRKLGCRIGGNVALHSVTAAFPAGSIIGVIGPEGSGKTTLLKLISGMIRRFEGEIVINGRLLASLGRRELPRLVSSCMDSLPENTEISLAEFLRFARVPLKGFLAPLTAYDMQVAEEYQTFFGLADLGSETLASLPGSALKKALIAFALIRQAPVLVMDNPSAGLDLRSTVLLQRSIARYAFDGERSVIMASHDLNFVAQTADCIYLMKEGTLSPEIPPEALDAAFVKKHFNTEVLVSRNIYNGRPEFHFFPEP